jgi:hypothetical protein
MAQGPAIQRSTALEEGGNLEAILKAVQDLTSVVIILTEEIKELKMIVELVTK